MCYIEFMLDFIQAGTVRQMLAQVDKVHKTLMHLNRMI